MEENTNKEELWLGHLYQNIIERARKNLKHDYIALPFLLACPIIYCSIPDFPNKKEVVVLFVFILLAGLIDNILSRRFIKRIELSKTAGELYYSVKKMMKVNLWIRCIGSTLVVIIFAYYLWNGNIENPGSLELGFMFIGFVIFFFTMLFKPRNLVQKDLLEDFEDLEQYVINDEEKSE